MPKWLLPTLSEVLALNDPTWMVESPGQASDMKPEGTTRRTVSRVALQQLRAEREWYGAIAALNILLQQQLAVPNNPAYAAAQTVAQASDDQAICGMILSGPTPVFNHPQVIKQFATRTLAANPLHSPNWMPFQLLPAEAGTDAGDRPLPVLPLLPGDPLAAEPFCLVMTPWFSLVMVLGETLTQQPAFLFSFVPEVVQQAWEAIRPRILLMTSHQIDRLDELVHQFSPVSPDYKTVMQFSRLMLEHLPHLPDDEALESVPHPPRHVNDSTETQKVETAQNVVHWQDSTHHTSPAVPKELDEKYLDVELVQAISHEVRTPLTTIRTLTRSLLKRTDLAPDVLKRLGIIDRECSEQINRFGLIFKATELETTVNPQPQMSLIRTSVVDVFQQSIPRWQQHASQRQMTLNIVLPEIMPAVVSDPVMLEQVLTSLIERFTRNLSAGSHIQVDVTLAGDQLKLQLQSLPDAADQEHSKGLFGASLPKSLPKSIGHMLMFQPETGSLSLTLSVTKNLFQAIGGKLTVKQKPKAGEIMTVYLPLEMESEISPLESGKIITV